MCAQARMFLLFFLFIPRIRPAGPRRPPEQRPGKPKTFSVRPVRAGTPKAFPVGSVRTGTPKPSLWDP